MYQTELLGITVFKNKKKYHSDVRYWPPRQGPGGDLYYTDLKKCVLEEQMSDDFLNISKEVWDILYKDVEQQRKLDAGEIPPRVPFEFYQSPVIDEKGGPDFLSAVARGFATTDKLDDLYEDFESLETVSILLRSLILFLKLSVKVNIPLVSALIKISNILSYLFIPPLLL